MPEYVITEQEVGERLDIILTNHSQNNLSRGQIQKLIHQGVNINKIVITKTGYKANFGDVVQWDETNYAHKELKPSLLPLNIIFENPDIIVINKPIGIMVHPDNFTDQDTIVQSALGHYPALIESVFEEGNPLSSIRPGIVHRLDRDTSGIMVIAKNRNTLLNLKEQFQKHIVQKEYLTFLYGEILEPVNVVAKIKRKSGDINKMTITKHPEQGKEAISHFKPIKYYQDHHITLCSVIIDTGRTHQIRVHAKSICHPVMGDTLYGNKSSINQSSNLGINRQMLHAWKLSFYQPNHMEELVTFCADLPNDFLAIDKDLTKC